jgi:hypothetical protein
MAAILVRSAMGRGGRRCWGEEHGNYQEGPPVDLTVFPPVVWAAFLGAVLLEGGSGSEGSGSGHGGGGETR